MSRQQSGVGDDRSQPASDKVFFSKPVGVRLKKVNFNNNVEDSAGKSRPRVHTPPLDLESPTVSIGGPGFPHLPPPSVSHSRPTRVVPPLGSTERRPATPPPLGRPRAGSLLDGTHLDPIVVRQEKAATAPLAAGAKPSPPLPPKLQQQSSISSNNNKPALKDALIPLRNKSGKVHKVPPLPPRESISNGPSEPQDDSFGRRNMTPPDLLALSNMYFDRQHSLMGDYPRVSESAHEHRQATADMSLMDRPSLPDLPARPSTSDDALLTQHRTMAARNGVKLAPLDLDHNKSAIMEEAGRIRVPADRKRSRTHGLHLSVNFTSQGWRQALDPLQLQEGGKGSELTEAEEREPGSAPHNTPEKVPGATKVVPGIEKGKKL